MSTRASSPAAGNTNIGMNGMGDSFLDIGHAIAQARQAMHMSQAELAERTGIQQPTLSRLEHGLSSPTINSLERIAAGLGLTLSVTFESPENESVQVRASRMK